MSSKESSSGHALGAWASPAVLSIAFVVALLLIALSMVLGLRNDRRLEQSNRSVAQTLEALEKTRQTGNLLFVAETSQRGYILRGDAADLRTYEEMRDLLPTRLDEMARLLSDTPEQRRQVEQLRELATRKFEHMDSTLDVYRREGQEGAIAAFRTGEDSGSLAAAREATRSILRTEGELLTKRRGIAADDSLRAEWFGLGSSLVIALALSIFYLLMRRFLKQRDQAVTELAAANVALERRVDERTVELSQLSRHLLNVREGEKKNIARDLHDEFGSYLTAINMDVSRVRDKISEATPEQAARLERTLGLLGHAIEMKRRLISELRPSILDNLGLGAALEQYIDEWSRHTGISTTFTYSGDLDSSEEGCPIAIFRVFQEALNNVAKHSRASEVTAFIRRDDDEIVFEIADNGCGLSDAARSKPGAHGLLGIRERVLAYHGRLDFATPPRGGTLIRARLDCRTRTLESDALRADPVLA